MKTSATKTRTTTGRTKCALAAALLGAAGMAQATFVTIGDPGNVPDGTGGYGAVGYTYQISATEVTIAEFQASGVGDGDEDYWNNGPRTVGTAAPASYVSLYEAKKYANYLTEQANGGSSAYNLYNADGTGAGSYTRADAINNGVTAYGVPTEDEWYKAAYWTGSDYSLYADGTHTVPTKGGGATGWNYDFVNSSPNYARDTALGSDEQNGTVNMMGNLWEWMEDSGGVLRGGTCFGTENYLRSSYRLPDYHPAFEGLSMGFRVVAVVPEPSSLALLILGGAGIVARRRRIAA